MSITTFRPLGPKVTKDGVSVAKEIELEDKFENMGAQMVKEVASKTNDNAGDGTTTATILAQAIVTEGLKYVTAGMNPMDIKRGIDKAVEHVIEKLKSSSKKVKANEEVAQVGTISANGEKSIGDMISKAMKKLVMIQPVPYVESILLDWWEDTNGENSTRRVV